MSVKLLVTHKFSLESRYGKKGVAAIYDAIRKLIEADAKRGLETAIVALDDKEEMADFGSAIGTAPPPKDFKDAIDRIFGSQKRRPDYLVILGSDQIVPFQIFKSPIATAHNVNVPAKIVDREPVRSDLPYACDAAWSEDIADFRGPSRVVGRIPDIRGAIDPAYLINVIESCTNANPIDAKSFSEYFALSSAEWTKQTRTSLEWIFGRSAEFAVSPNNGPDFPPEVLARRCHFINCHGYSKSPYFIGKDDNGDQFDALEAASLGHNDLEGIIVAAECCFGAQLYDPADANRNQPSICNTYLKKGAYGFFGSTNTAYGPDDDPGDRGADRLCQLFLRSVLDGASLGRAVLEARQHFVGEVPVLYPIDQKTLAQFILLGDPSIQPVVTIWQQNLFTQAKQLSQDGGLAKTHAALRHQRRRDARHRGHELSKTKPVSGRPGSVQRAPEIERGLRDFANREDLSKPVFISFAVERPLPLEEKVRFPEAVHYVIGVRKAGRKGRSQKLTFEIPEFEGRFGRARRFHTK